MRRNAHTLAELVLVLVIMGALTAVAIPRLSFRAVQHKKLVGAAYKLMADLRRTRSLALRDAAAHNLGYRLEMVGASPYTEYRIEEANTEAEVDRISVDSSITVTASPTSSFVFSPIGDMTSGGNSQIDLSAEGKSFTLTFVLETGAVLCVEN